MNFRGAQINSRENTRLINPKLFKYSITYRLNFLVNVWSNVRVAPTGSYVVIIKRLPKYSEFYTIKYDHAASHSLIKTAKRL